jgi:putative chitinase
VSLPPAKLEAVIRTVMPACKEPSLWSRYLGEATATFSITSADRLDDFLAQIAVESMELNRLTENLNYSAERLMAVWPKRFPTLQDAQRCAHNPQALAEKVYGGRMGNQPGEGYLYRGRGLIQITGRDNYVRIGILLGDASIPIAPERLQEPRWAALSAAAYWKDRGLNELAEARAGDNAKADFLTITKAVNGGAHGLEQRQLYWTRARTALGLARVNDYAEQRFIMTALSGAGTWLLCWFGKISDEVYGFVTVGIVGGFIGAEAYLTIKSKLQAKAQPEA